MTTIVRDTLRPRREPPALAGAELDGIVAHPRPFVCDVVVDDAGISRTVAHVSNVQFVAWLDRVAELHCDAMDLTRERMLDGGHMWFVVRHEIDYVAEVLPGDRLHVFTWVRDVSRVKSWRDTVMIRAADGAVVNRAATLWVLVDLASRRPMRVPVEMRRRLDPLHPPRDPAPCTSD